jgi:murein DD-endopeptidase MepM/ murein hydrolase activator NlpD
MTYSSSKPQRNKNIKNLCAKTIFTVLSLGLITVPFGVLADTASDVAAEKAAKQKQLEELNKQISEYSAQVQQKRSQAASLSNEVALYNLEIQTTELKIQATQTNIDNTQLQIEQTKEQIELKKQQIEQEKALLAQLIVTLQQYDNTSAMQIGLGSNNFSDFMDQVQYTETVQNKVFSLLQQIKDIKAKLEKDQQELEANLEQLNVLGDQLNQTQASLNDQKAGKVQLLNQTKGQESTYKKLLTASQDAEAKIQKEIQDLDAKAAGKNTYKGLPVVKGILAWPIDGVLTQKYGNTGFTSLGYNFHNGVDIAGPAGTPVHAAGDGKVNATGTGTTAYGNWVTIKHEAGGKLDRDIVTLYGHMTKFIVKTGQTVKKGDVIGYEGNTGNTSRLLYGPDRGYHVHFTVFDAVGFTVTPGAYPKVYGPYQIPSGYTYDPQKFF